jgi:hypothetical protein
MLLENTPRCAIVLLPARSRLNLNLGRNEIDLPAIPKTPVWLGMGDDELGRDRLPDAPLGCHPPCVDLPCGPEAEPVVRACKRARGESAGDWIDAALADEGWWGEEAFFYKSNIILFTLI